MIKTLKIKEKVWRRINLLRIKWRLKNLGDVVEVLIKLEKDYSPEVEDILTKMKGGSQKKHGKSRNN